MSMRSTLLLSFLAGALPLAACGPDAAGPGSGTPPRCGNQIVEGAEECDDGNTTEGDGCSKICRIEEGPMDVCGDGVIGQTEACDDANTTAADGCSSGCSVEGGFTCAGAPSVCTPQNPGAMGTCAAPFVITLADDGQGNLTGSGTGDTTSSTNQVAAAPCDGSDPAPGAGNDHVWSFTTTDERDVFVLLPSTVAFDAIIRVTSAACDVGTEIKEYTGSPDGCSNDGVTMESEALAYTKLPAGTYYVTVDGVDAAALGTYEVRVIASTTTCGDGQLDLLDFCDDGNSTAGDGCSPKCEVETGYTCNDASPSVCTMGGGGGTPVAPAIGDLKINEYMGADNTADTNCDGATTDSKDEFIELVNVSTKTLDLTGVSIWDSAAVTFGQPRHAFAASQTGSLTLAPGKAVVVWGGGVPACNGVDNFFVATTGSLSLNDAGDTVLVKSAAATTLVTLTYASTTLKVSANLNPDLTGTAYIDHPLIGTKRWSPGRKTDDTAF